MHTANAKIAKEKTRALRKVQRTNQTLASAVTQRNEAIKAALEMCSVREVARSAGLSPARVHQIRHGR